MDCIYVIWRTKICLELIGRMLDRIILYSTRSEFMYVWYDDLAEWQRE